MPVDVVEQVRRLVESFDEFVDDVSTDEVVRRVKGGSDSREPAYPTPAERSFDERSSWRRFSLVAAVIVLVAGLAGALVWVNARRSPPLSDTPPPTTLAPVPAGLWGQFVWPAPPRGYATLDVLVTAFTAEVLAWDPSDAARVGDANDRPQPQTLTLVNELLGGSVLLIAIPSPQGWGFVQIGEGLSASVDEGESVVVELASRPSAASGSIEARLSDGTSVTATATSPGTFELPGEARLEEVVSALVVGFDEQGNVIAATGGMFASNDLQTPSTGSSMTAEATGGRPDTELATYRFDSDEGWPGALIGGRLDLRSGCLALTTTSGTYPVIVPSDMTVHPDGDRLVMSGAADIPLAVDVTFGGGETNEGAFDQLHVSDPRHCLEAATVILLVPDLI